MKMADHTQQNQQPQQTQQAQHQQQHSAQQQQTQQQQQAAVQQGSSQQQNVSASGVQSSNAMNTIVGGQSLTSTMAANAAAVAAAGIRNPIPQVQVIPQIHSPPYISQFPYNQQQQQIMLQNAAMQAAMQASAMNMNPQQFNMNMNMAAMMQGRPQSVSGNMSSPANLMSPSPTTPTQQNPNVNFSSTATTQVTNSNTQSANGKVANGNKGQTTQGQTQQAQATALVGGKPIMPTQGMAAGGPPPLVLGQFSVLPNQLGGNSPGFVTAQSKGQAVSMAMSAAHSGQQQVISSQAPLRFTQPQLVSSTGQIFTSQPMLTNQAMLQAMANLQQQGIPLAHQPLLSATGQSPTILSAGQQLFIRPANQIAPQQGMMTAGVQTIGTTMKQGSRVDMPQNLQVKASAVGGISKQAAGAQAGKAILPQLPKTAMAKISPTHIGGQRPKLSIPSLPRKQNRGRPCNPNKAAAVTTATAATNTVASALSQAKANAASTSQSKPATPTNQAMNCQSKSQSDSEVEAIKKTSTTNGILETRPAEPRTKDTLPDVVNSTSDQIAPERASMDNSVLGNREAPVVVEKQRAIVKPHILTHVIEGFVIQEGPEPFPVERSSLLTEFIPPKPGQQMDGIQMAESSNMDTEENMSGDKKLTDSKPHFDKCDFCGKEKQSKKFRRSNRFCSMPCARRFNVACSRRISLFKAKGRPPSISGGKVLKKKPLFALRKGWRARGRGGRLSYNTGQRNLPGDMDIDEEQYDPADNSSSPSSENESSTTPDSPVTVQGTGDLDTPPSNPARWNVLEVYEFIKSMQGCASYAEEFRSQEIDGQALMLLKEDHLMTAMNMKLGPALKICARINSLKDETV